MKKLIFLLLLMFTVVLVAGCQSNEAQPTATVESVAAPTVEVVPTEEPAAEPTAESLQGLLQVRGESVPVVAVDSGGASLFVVRDRAAIVKLAILEEAGRRKDSLRRKTINSQQSKAVRRTSGDRVVIAAGRPRGEPGTTNLWLVEEVGAPGAQDSKENST